VSRDLVCREVVELLNGYLDGALPADARAAVEAHLAGCDGCTMVLDEFRQTIAMTGMLVEEEQVRSDQREILLAAFRGWALT
jgi:anti-sigma factor RsiW